MKTYDIVMLSTILICCIFALYYWRKEKKREEEFRRSDQELLDYLENGRKEVTGDENPKS